MEYGRAGSGSSTGIRNRYTGDTNVFSRAADAPTLAHEAQPKSDQLETTVMNNIVPKCMGRSQNTG